MEAASERKKKAADKGGASGKQPSPFSIHRMLGSFFLLPSPLCGLDSRFLSPPRLAAFYQSPPLNLPKASFPHPFLSRFKPLSSSFCSLSPP